MDKRFAKMKRQAVQEATLEIIHTKSTILSLVIQTFCKLKQQSLKTNTSAHPDYQQAQPQDIENLFVEMRAEQAACDLERKELMQEVLQSQDQDSHLSANDKQTI